MTPFSGDHEQEDGDKSMQEVREDLAEEKGEGPGGV